MEKETMWVKELDNAEVEDGVITFKVSLYQKWDMEMHDCDVEDEIENKFNARVDSYDFKDIDEDEDCCTCVINFTSFEEINKNKRKEALKEILNWSKCYGKYGFELTYVTINKYEEDEEDITIKKLELTDEELQDIAYSIGKTVYYSTSDNAISIDPFFYADPDMVNLDDENDRQVYLETDGYDKVFKA